MNDVAWEARDLAMESRHAVERMEKRIVLLEKALIAYANNATVGPHSAREKMFDQLEGGH
jgi:hypothetical protein